MSTLRTLLFIVWGLVLVQLPVRNCDELPRPSWTAPKGDPKKPVGGWEFVPNATYTLVYNATPAIGTYNHAAMITFGAEIQDKPLFTLSWKNSPVNEDSPGQRILVSQSYDGITWTPTDGSTNILFPNMSTNSNPAALFAEPFLYLNGHLYAAASPQQFCLYPDPYQEVLLLRRVYTNATGVYGPVFWATSPAPAAFAEASKLNNVVDISQMDTVTQQDVALLTPTASNVPCSVPNDSTNKCEACATGCQSWKDYKLGNERTHYTMPNTDANSTNDVLLYRSNKDPYLYASVREKPGSDSWTAITPTDIPNDESNLNSGSLPDGRRYLLSNAMPFTIRDPLTIATTTNGLEWNRCQVAMSCTKLPGDRCGPVYPGKAKNPGPSYPQGVVVPSMDALFVVATNNKENVWVGKLPLSSI